MAKSFEQMMEELHTLLQKSLVAAPQGGKPTSVVGLLFPGVGIDPKQYDGMEGRENPMCALVDEVLRPGVVYAPLGNKLSAFYGQILKNTQVPQSRGLTKEERTRLNLAREYIKNNSKQYLTHKRNYDDATAVLQLSTFLNRLERGRAQNKVGDIMTNWKACGKQKYEDYSRQVRELLISSPAAYFDSATEQYDLFGSELAATFSPADWFQDDDHLGWTQINFDQSSSRSATTTKSVHSDETIHNIYRQTGAWATICGWFGSRYEVSQPQMTKNVVEESASNVSYESMALHLETALVAVSRPWLDLGPLTVGGTQLAGYRAGAVSTGELSPNNNGALPAYATGLILARNVEMEMQMSKEMASYLQSVTNSGATQSTQCGPFCLNQSATVTVTENSDKKGSDLLSVHISAGPQKQIIGYVTTVLPRFPEKDWNAR